MSPRPVQSPVYEPVVGETALGPIEYAVVGEGAAVVVLHGSPAASTALH